MDGPKHRWFIILGALLAGGVLLLLGQQWVSTSSEPVPAAASVTASQVTKPKPQPETPASTNVEVAATAAAPPAAAAGGTFRGRVIDAVTRQPVREFEVRLIPLPTSSEAYGEAKPLTRTFKSGSGRFAWSNLKPRRWMVTVSAHAYQQFVIEELTTAAGEKSPEHVMPLLHGFTLRGRVFDLNTGVGIGAALVSLQEPDRAYHGDSQTSPFVRSKEDGTFELDGVPGGDMTLSASAKGYAARELDLIVGDETQAVDIGLSTGSTLSGRVVTPAGAPIKGLINLLGGPGGGSYQTTDDGVFTFGQLPAGTYVLTGTTTAGSAREKIELGPDEHRSNVTLKVVAGRIIRGTIRGLRPEHLEHAFVSAQSAANRQFFQARVDDQATYVLKNLPPGQSTLTVYTRSRRLEKTVNVPADRDVVLDIVFPPGSRLTGRVTQDGEAAVDKSIMMRAADPKAQILYQAQTSQDGQYEIEGLPAGEYRLRADEDIGRSVTIAGDTVLNIEIPLVQVGGRVLEEAGAVPIVSADIYVRGLDAATSRVRAHKESDHFGQFKLTGVEPGDVELIVYKPGYEIYREKITYSSPITDKAIRLSQGGGVEIRVRRAANGESVRGFYVSDKIADNDWVIDYWIPLDRNGIGFIPSALVGRTLMINAFTGKPIAIRDWDGSPLDLTM